MKSQLTRFWDSLRYDLHQEKSWYICLDGKNSIVKDQNIKLIGLQSGYTFNNRTNLFLGYYFNNFNGGVVIDNPTANINQVDSNTVYARYRLSYLSFGTESYIVNSRKWRMSIPLAIGIGKGHGEKYKIGSNKEVNVFERPEKNIYPLEIGFYINYKIKWWIWAGAGIGTRFALNGGEYSGSYYTYGLSLRFGEIYNRARAWYREKNSSY